MPPSTREPSIIAPLCLSFRKDQEPPPVLRQPAPDRPPLPPPPRRVHPPHVEDARKERGEQQQHQRGQAHVSHQPGQGLLHGHRHLVGQVLLPGGAAQEQGSGQGLWGRQ